MATFAYRARDRQGRVIQGTHDAPDRAGALAALREANLFVTQLEPSPGAKASTANPVLAPSSVGGSQVTGVQASPQHAARPERVYAAAAANSPHNIPQVYSPSTEARPDGGAYTNTSHSASSGAAYTSNTNTAYKATSRTPDNANTDYFARASNKDISLFFRQAHTMLHAGTALSHTLGTLGKHGTNAALRRAAGEMSKRILEGESWSTTMKSYPGLFSELAQGMIAAGEQGGFLERMCLRLADYAERDYELEQTIKRETWYPKLLLLASILIPALPALVLKGVGAALQEVVPQLLVLAAIWVAWKAFVWASPLVKSLGSVRQVLDGVKLLIPVGGKVSRALATAKFCRAMGALYSAGVGPSRATEMAAQACGNEAMAASTMRIIPRLEHGEKLSDTLQSTGYYSGIALQMLRTGEETGAIDTQLDKVADFLEADAETAVKQAVKVLGILVFLFVAYKVGTQVISFYTGSGYGGEMTNIMDEIDKA